MTATLGLYVLMVILNGETSQVGNPTVDLIICDINYTACVCPMDPRIVIQLMDHNYPSLLWNWSPRLCRGFYDQ